MSPTPVKNHKQSSEYQVIKTKYRKLDPKRWTATQLQERAKRRMLDRRMRFGMSTPKGIRPRQLDAAQPVFKPMPAPRVHTSPDLGILAALFSLLPWIGRRKRRQAELQQHQRAQSIKAQGVK